MIEIRDGRYFSQMWHVFGKDQDWMAALWRDGDGPFHLQYRFRYYVDNKAHNSDDVRSWYQVDFTPGTPEDEALRGGNAAADIMARAFGGVEVHKLVLRTSNVAEIEAEMRRESFMHFAPHGEPKDG